MLQIANTTGKNSTDSALIIDAMDLLYSGNVDAFALVSSDSDFTSLAIRLRGLGPDRLRDGAAQDAAVAAPGRGPVHLPGGPARRRRRPRSPRPAEEATEPRRIPDLRRLLERAVNGTSHDDGWASLSSIANHVTRVEPSFSVKDYGASKLVDLVRAQDYLEVEQPDGGSVRVRLTTKRSNRGGANQEDASQEERRRARETASKDGAGKDGASKKAAAKKAPEPVSKRRGTRPGAGGRRLGARAAEPAHTVTTRKRSERAPRKSSERVGLHELGQPLELVGVGARQHAVPEVEHVAVRGAAGLDDLGGALRSSPRSGRRPGSGRGCPARPGRRPGRWRCRAASASRRRRRRRRPRP